MVSQDIWDIRLCEHHGHLLQSWKWGEFKRLHDWCPERLLVETSDGIAMAQMFFRRKGPVSLGYIPRGPLIVGDTEALWSRLRAAIDEVARKRRAISVIMEPETPLAIGCDGHSDDLRSGPEHIQPVRTVKVPLLEDEELLGQMHRKTRYNVRRASRCGVKFREMEPTRQNVACFYRILQDTARRNEFSIHPFEYYRDVLELLGDDAALLGAWTPEGELAAALIVAKFGDEAIYLYGASSTIHRSHGEGLALQFEAMKWARSRGCSVYDLWGIPANDPDACTENDGHRLAGTRGKDWRGLYRFKTGFGGTIVSYPPTSERRYMPVLPWLAGRLNVIG